MTGFSRWRVGGEWRAGAGPRFLIAIDRASGRQLMAVSCERRGSASYTSGVLVNRLRKQVEKLQNPQAR